jgi:7-cyano-7-deazaguanine synthase
VNETAILLSGGLDSAALAFWLKPQLGITVDYGQASARGEIRAAAQIAADLGVKHEVIRLDCSSLGSGDLALKPAMTGAPAPEWWPYRNQFLITVAAMKTIPMGISRLLVGSVKSDSFHVDGRPEFFEQIDCLIAMQEGGLRVEAPALGFTTVELIRHCGVPDGILGWTHSCHKAEFACGNCRGCWKRQEVLNELGW